MYDNVWKSCLSICEHIVLLWFLKYCVLSILFQFCFQSNKYDDYWNQVHTFFPSWIHIYERNRRYFFLINQIFWSLGCKDGSLSVSLLFYLVLSLLFSLVHKWHILCSVLTCVLSMFWVVSLSSECSWVRSERTSQKWPAWSWSCTIVHHHNKSSRRS